MTLGVNVAWEVMPSTGNDNNGGGFSLSGGTYDSGGIGNKTTAFFNVGSNYTAENSDVGHYLYVQGGIHSLPGLYPITGVLGQLLVLGAPDPAVLPFSGTASQDASTSQSWTIDRSRAGAPFVTFDGATVTASNGAAGATITLSGYTVTVADVGNIVNITGGTNFTTGRYQINAVNVGSNTWTFDRNCTTGAGAAMTGRMGGALKTIQTAYDAQKNNGSAQNQTWVKSEATITTTATIHVTVPNYPGGATNVPWSRLAGYYQKRGDIYQSAPGTWVNNAHRPLIQLSTNTGLIGLSLEANTAVPIQVENLIVDCSNLGTSNGILNNQGGAFVQSQIVNCAVKNFTSNGIRIAGFATGVLCDCEVTGGGAAASAAVIPINTTVMRCNVHDNACIGITDLGSQNTQVVQCLVANNTGASSDGIDLAGGNTAVIGCTIYGNGRDGIRFTEQTGTEGIQVRNNIISSNSGYGLNIAGSAGSPAVPWFDGNAYYNNTLGTRNNADDTGSAFPINMVAPHVNNLDVVLTQDPFVDSATGDFRISQSAAAALYGKGTPGAMPGISYLGYPDFGAFQHKDKGSFVGSRPVPALLLP